LSKVYSWYFGKLESIGQLTSADKQDEETLLNPNRL